jgi:hypothetical protein
MIAAPTDRRALVMSAARRPRATALVAAVTAALDHLRAPAKWSCDGCCPSCEAVKAKRFSCKDCGFHGRPQTIACDCARGLELQISFNEAALRRYPTDEAWPAGWRTSRTDMVDEQTKLLVLALTPIGRCRGGGHGQPPTGAQWRFVGNCSHGWPTCPACGGGHGDGEADTAQLLAVVRGVRRALKCAGGAP